MAMYADIKYGMVQILGILRRTELVSYKLHLLSY